MNKLTFAIITFTLFLAIPQIPILAQEPNQPVWIPDLQNGTYKNPVIYTDYSDPDVVYANKKFYLVASSFNCVPGLPILESEDLVNWKLIGYAIQKLEPEDIFDIPQHGKGVWAPSIRFHNGEFYIYWGDPDYGIYMVKSKNPAGEWSKPHLVKKEKGWIDPCPFWDNDGNAYLVHGWAGSRAGIKSILTINKMNSEGTQILDHGVLIFDGHPNHATVEGPKMYKLNDWYYILAPAGGVKTGWQLALRSKNIYGPYETKIVLEQGNTLINGPHQGAWISLENNQMWFIHFQDADAFGRIVHLQPINMIDNWPMMGEKNTNNSWQPVLTYKKPVINKTEIIAPQTSDDFNSHTLGLQWQWNANQKSNWYFSSGNLGFLRYYATLQPAHFINLWDSPNLLLQKFTAPGFSFTAKCKISLNKEDEKIGLVIMGSDYACLGLQKKESGLLLYQSTSLNADKKNEEQITDSLIINQSEIYLRIKVQPNAECTFYYSLNGKNFQAIGTRFTAKPGVWIGARIGFFGIRKNFSNDAGYMDIDWCKIEK